MTRQNSPIILGEEEIRKRLRMEDLIPAMAEALRDLSAGAVLQPLRTVLSISSHNGFLGVMPASYLLCVCWTTWLPPGSAIFGFEQHHPMENLCYLYETLINV